MMMRRIGAAALVISLVACGGQERPPLPEGFDDGALVDGKADTLTRWFTQVKGEIDFNTTITGKTSYKSWFHGYTIDLGAGDEVAVKAAGSYYGLIRIYGPQKASGRWGSAKASSWINYDSTQQAFGGAISSFKAKAAGTYLLLVGSPWDPSYNYSVSAGCTSGHCGDAFCVVYETVDSTGKPLQNIYAINVATYDAGKQLLAKVSNFVNEDILTGACGSVALACPKVYKPVCGDSPGLAKQTFGNVCNFKAYLMGLAGQTSEAKGHWEAGACVVGCTYDGKQYNVGDVFYPDACNTCSCSASGMVNCTKMMCTCDPKAEWWRKYVSTDPKKCQVMKFYCQPNTLYFSNECGCGCEQSKDCKAYYDCEPPTDCSLHKAKCPYSTFGL
jgi:hypothetical protein